MLHTSTASCSRKPALRDQCVHHQSKEKFSLWSGGLQERYHTWWRWYHQECAELPSSLVILIDHRTIWWAKALNGNVLSTYEMFACLLYKALAHTKSMQLMFCKSLWTVMSMEPMKTLRTRLQILGLVRIFMRTQLEVHAALLLVCLVNLRWWHHRKVFFQKKSYVARGTFPSENSFCALLQKNWSHFEHTCKELKHFETAGHSSLSRLVPDKVYALQGCFASIWTHILFFFFMTLPHCQRTSPSVSILQLVLKW